MRAAGWRPGCLADHSSADRCSVASPDRGDLTRSNLARESGELLMESEKRQARRTRRERDRGRENTQTHKHKGRGGEEGWEIKRDKQRGVGGGRRVVPQGDHSWCLTPLVLLMCDAQEIDRLCKTQPTGENNNNNNNTDT